MAPKKKTQTTETAPAATPAPVETVAPTTTTETPVVEVDRFAAVLEKLQGFSNDLKETIAHVKFLQKEHVKLQKSTNKKTKKVATGGQRILSGFAKPSLLSEQLCQFMGVAKGTSMARTEVTRSINDYIKKNSLQDAADKRHILPDAKLSEILNLTGDDKLTYFNLQKYMKHHFTKEA
jgi:chromatin remodeling complex protein RSC6